MGMQHGRDKRPISSIKSGFVARSRICRAHGQTTRGARRSNIGGAAVGAAATLCGTCATVVAGAVSGAVLVAIDQIKRFERWRRTLPKNTAYFVSLVLDEVVPLFEARGFDRFRDYAAGSTFAVGSELHPTTTQERCGMANVGNLVSQATSAKS